MELNLCNFFPESDEQNICKICNINNIKKESFMCINCVKKINDGFILYKKLWSYCKNCNLEMVYYKFILCYNCYDLSKKRYWINKLSSDFNNKLDFNFLNLPIEMIVLILEKLEIKFILNCQLICKRFKNLINVQKSILINLELKKIHKQKYLPFSKFINLNFEILKKIKIKLFRQPEIPCKMKAIKFNRFFRMYDLKFIIGARFMSPPHKIKFQLIKKKKNNIKIEIINNNIIFKKLDNNFILEEIENIRGPFFLFPNEKKIKLLIKLSQA